MLIFISCLVMKTANIISTFEKYPDAKVLFFFDATGDYQQELQKAELKEVEWMMPGAMGLQEKQVILERAAKGNLLLYFPHPRPTGKAWERFPLRGLYHANRELILDEVSDFLEQFQLAEKHRPLITKYIKWLSKQSYRQHLSHLLDSDSFHQSPLEVGLIAYAFDLDGQATREHILIRLMRIGASGDGPLLQKVQRRLGDLALLEKCLGWIALYFGVELKTLTLESVQELALIFKYNVLLKEINTPVAEDQYQRLHVKDKRVRNNLGKLLFAWQQHARLQPALSDFISGLTEIGEEKMVAWYGIDAAYGYETRALSLARLSALLPLVLDNPAQAEERLRHWQSRLSGDSDLQKVLNSVWHATKMLTILQAYPSFRLSSAKLLWRKYEEELWQVDYHFRKTFVTYLLDGTFDLPQVDKLHTYVNDRYERYLIDLNNAWMELIQEDPDALLSLPVPRQQEFYRQFVKPLEAKAVVIVSDAFRYECAQELRERLVQDGKNDVQLGSMLSAIPSVTRLGMANLLPQQAIEVQLQESGTGLALEVLVDGQTTQGLEQRHKVLQRYQSTFAAVQFAEVNNWSRQEAREFFKNHDTVYVYHNHIDAVADKRSTQSLTLDAVEDSLNELEGLISKLTKSWNRTHVVLCSDHGFIYQHRPVADSWLEDFPSLPDPLELHQRYMLVRRGRGKVAGYRIPLSRLLPCDEDIDMILPRGVNRFRRQGVGHKFVHGGLSLQELAVPGLTVYRKREDTAEPVPVRIWPEKKILTSGTLKINVLQEEPVSNTVRPREVILGLYSEQGELMSREQHLHLNSTAASPKDRMFSVILELSGSANESTMCQFRAYDSEDIRKLSPITDQRIVVNLLIEKDEF